jgi:hypothetical protein
LPPVPDCPTRDDASAALKLLEGLLTGFPFVDDVAIACALSAIITPVVRGAFLVAPLHASRAPTAGSGKSFLWDTVAAIAIGQLMPVMSTGPDETEMEKRLGTAMMTGQPLISIDNISKELGGDALCQIIERPVVEIRILGRSERVRIEARGTTLFATGNNFVIVGDVCQRMIYRSGYGGLGAPLRDRSVNDWDREVHTAALRSVAYLLACRQVRWLASFGAGAMVRSARSGPAG